MAIDHVTIRRLGATDAELWRTVRLEALKNAPEAFGQSYEHASQQPLSYFAEVVAKPEPIMVAIADDRAVGTGGLYTIAGPKTAHRSMLWGMYVAPEFRGTGVADRLVEAVIGAAAPTIRQVHLRVVTENARAYKLYRRLSFEPYGIEPRALSYNGRYYDETLMVRML